MGIEPLLQSSSNEWATPQDLYDKLNSVFNFNLDPCSTHENAKCENHYTIEDNGLDRSWNGVSFCNPPYGRELPLWVQKAYEESVKGNKVVMLIPARPDTIYWHTYIFKYAKAVCFIKGRLHFGNAIHAAPFPSAIVVFQSENLTQEQEDILSSFGYYMSVSYRGPVRRTLNAETEDRSF